MMKKIRKGSVERMSSEKYASPEIMLKLMLYAYHERNRISSRNIEKTAIARFRTRHFAKCAQSFLAQMTKLLHELGQITTTEVFIDGTKIEASANKYTFV